MTKPMTPERWAAKEAKREANRKAHSEQRALVRSGQAGASRARTVALVAEVIRLDDPSAVRAAREEALGSLRAMLLEARQAGDFSPAVGAARALLEHLPADLGDLSADELASMSDEKLGEFADRVIARLKAWRDGR